MAAPFAVEKNILKEWLLAQTVHLDFVDDKAGFSVFQPERNNIGHIFRCDQILRCKIRTQKAGQICKDSAGAEDVNAKAVGLIFNCERLGQTQKGMFTDGENTLVLISAVCNDRADIDDCCNI